MKKVFKKSTAILVILLVIASLFVFSSCKPKQRVMEEDTVFYIDLENTKVKNKKLNLFLDEESNITLTSDGKASINIKADKALSGYVYLALRSGAVDDLEIEPVFLDLGAEYFPGFDLHNMEKTFQLLDNALNLKLVGFDFSNPDTQAAFSEFADTGKIPTDFVLPNDLEIVYSADYYIKDITSEYSNKTFTGIFMGQHTENGEPFIMMDLITDDDGKTHISYNNDMVMLKLKTKPVDLGK